MIQEPTCVPPHPAETVLHDRRWDLETVAEKEKIAPGTFSTQTPPMTVLSIMEMSSVLAACGFPTERLVC